MKHFLKNIFLALVSLFLLNSCSEDEKTSTFQDFFVGKWELKKSGIVTSSNQRSVSDIIPQGNCTSFDSFTFNKNGSFQIEKYSFANNQCNSELINGTYQRNFRNVSLKYTIPGDTEETVIEGTIFQTNQTRFDFVYVQNQQIRVWVMERAQ